MRPCLEQPETLHWDYDEEADVLYMSLGQPRPAVGVDVDEGVVVRFDEGNSASLG